MAIFRVGQRLLLLAPRRAAVEGMLSTRFYDLTQLGDRLRGLLSLTTITRTVDMVLPSVSRVAMPAEDAESRRELLSSLDWPPSLFFP